MAHQNTQKKPTEYRGIVQFLTRARGRRRFDITDVLTYMYLLAGVVVMFGPVLWLVMSSFKPPSLLTKKPITFLPYRQDTVEIEGQRQPLPLYDVKLPDGSTKRLAATVSTLSGAERVTTDNYILMVPFDAPDSEPVPVLTENALALYEARIEGETRVLAVPLKKDGEETGKRYSYFRMVPPDDPYSAPVEIRYSQSDPEAYPRNPIDPFNEVTIDVTIQAEALQLYDVMLPAGTTVNAPVTTGETVTIESITLQEDTPTRVAALVDPNGNLQPVRRAEDMYLRVILPDDPSRTPLEVNVTGYLGSEYSVADITGDNMTEALNNGTGATIELAERELALVVYEVRLPDGTLGPMAALIDPPGPRLQEVQKTFLAMVDPANPDSEPLEVLEDNALPIRVAVPGYDTQLPRYNIIQEDGTIAEMVALLDGDGNVQRRKESYYTMIDPKDPEGERYQVPRENATVVRSVYFDLGNYEGAIDSFDFMVYLRNSVIVTVVATAVTLLINSMAAFGLSKYKFVGRDVIFLIIVSTLMVPVSVILIPAFLVITEVGWANNLWGLIIPGAATPTGVFLLRQYMLTIPDELLDSARIDGASEWRIYWQVVLPLARPALAVLAIFSVMWRWNDFLWPLVVVTRNDLYTLPVALNNFQGNLNVQWNYILAMTVLTLLPITLVFAFLQRFITSGIATTGMKG